MADTEQRLEEDGSKEMKEPVEKKQKLEEEVKSEKPKLDYGFLYDSDGYSDDDGARQRDIKKYNDQVEASGGYEVDYFPKLALIGLTVSRGVRTLLRGGAHAPPEILEKNYRWPFSLSPLNITA